MSCLLDEYIEHLTYLVIRCQTSQLHQTDPGPARPEKEAKSTIDLSLLKGVLTNNY
jgi:hypothetical protein